jgi:ATP-binding cassette subfamily C (CFTR/MRP) protein 1
LAIDVQGDFTFESLPLNPDEAKEIKSISDEKDQEKPASIPFALRDIHLAVPRGESELSAPLISGALVCIVGRVGTGKSALLLGMINEMRQTRGHTLFGGTVTYGKSS